jgi:arsenate reductase
MPIKIYEYKNCSTCKNALKYLETKKLKYQKVPIVDEPPSVGELKQMLAYLEAQGKSFKNLFNTSGEQYRELKIADKIKAGMTASEAIQLLSKNGKLIKRPFVLADKNGTVGFKLEEWNQIFIK